MAKNEIKKLSLEEIVQRQEAMVGQGPRVSVPRRFGPTIVPVKK